MALFCCKSFAAGPFLNGLDSLRYLDINARIIQMDRSLDADALLLAGGQRIARLSNLDVDPVETMPFADSHNPSFAEQYRVCARVCVGRRLVLAGLAHGTCHLFDADSGALLHALSPFAVGGFLRLRDAVLDAARGFVCALRNSVIAFDVHTGVVTQHIGVQESRVCLLTADEYASSGGQSAVRWSLGGYRLLRHTNRHTATRTALRNKQRNLAAVNLPWCIPDAVCGGRAGSSHALWLRD